MEQNVLNHNSPFSLGKAMLISVSVAIIGYASLTGASALITKKYVEAPVYSYDTTQPSYGALAVSITSGNTGKAVINLNGFRVYTNYKFNSAQDTRGGLEGEFTAIDIYDLAIDVVLDANGNKYSEKIINKDDIRNMISVIKAHIEKNKMVGPV